MTLADVWFVLFILIIAGYLILDGFDMGVGILHLPSPATDLERRTFLNSIGPVWDGNEVWLVLARRRPVRRASRSSTPRCSPASISRSCWSCWCLILRTVSIEFRSKEPVAALAVGLGHGFGSPRSASRCCWASRSATSSRACRSMPRATWTSR